MDKGQPNDVLCGTISVSQSSCHFQAYSSLPFNGQVLSVSLNTADSHSVRCCMRRSSETGQIKSVNELVLSMAKIRMVGDGLSKVPL